MKDKNDGKVLRWVLGCILLLFLMGVYVFDVREMTHTRQQLLGFFGAITAALFTYLLSGTLMFRYFRQGRWLGSIYVRATGAIAVFLLVLWWWNGPYSPAVVQNNYYNRILQKFQADVGYPPRAGNGGLSPAEYSRRAQLFFTKNNVDSETRQRIFATINPNRELEFGEESRTRTETKSNELSSTENLAVHHDASPTNDHRDLLGSEPPPYLLPNPEVIHAPSNFIDKLRQSPPAHGAGVLLDVFDRNGRKLKFGEPVSGQLGERLSTKVRVQNFDGFNDSWMITNVTLVLVISNATIEMPSDFIGYPVELQSCGDAITFSTSYEINGLEGDRFRLIAEVGMLDFHNGAQGLGLAQQVLMRGFGPELEIKSR